MARRRRGYRGFLTGFLAIVVVGGGLWGWWSHVAAARLQSQLDAIRARHEPLLATDFKYSPVPRQQNAAKYLLAAVNALSTVNPPSSSNSTYNNYPPFPPTWHRMVEQSTAANSGAMLLAHQSAAFTRADWGGTNPPWNQLRQLANVISDAAIEAHLKGDDVLAVQRIDDLRHEADVLQASRSIVSYLVAMAIRSMAIEDLEIILPDLRVNGDISKPRAGAADAPAATTNSLKQLIIELLDESQADEAQRAALLAERSVAYAAVRAMREDATVLRPMFDLEGARFLAYQNDVLTASQRPDFPSAEAMLAPGETYANVANILLLRPASSRLLWGESRFLHQCYLESADRRAAATALAIRLYRAHHGVWPSNLEQLVPDFLPAVPRDPLL